MKCLELSTRVSSNRFSMTFHETILNAAHQIGYSSHELCQNLTLHWIEARLTHQEDEFDQQIKKFVALSHPLKERVPDLKEISALSSSQKVHFLGELKPIYSEPLIYTEQQIQLYLEEIRNIIDNQSFPKKPPLSLLLGRSDYTLA